ncbi:MAG: transposase [Bacteroidales bacterium]|nr:transposase [Bacteroidales bacterium]
MSEDTKSPNANPISEINTFSSPLFNLSPVCKKPIEMSFSAGKISSDGGLLLLRETNHPVSQTTFRKPARPTLSLASLFSRNFGL